MEKHAPANYEINDLLSRRWSPRAFSQRPVDGASLRRLFEAARWAPSSSNEQPWYYLVGTSEFPAEHEKILSVIMEGNQRWARRAPVLMISVARLVWAKDGSPNRHAF